MKDKDTNDMKKYFLVSILLLLGTMLGTATAQIITLALRRAQSQQDNILDFIPSGITLLPNTSGASQRWWQSHS